MINQVALTGRLTKDLDLKYTQSGTAVASGTLAVNRQFKNQNGEQEADFIQIVAWRKTAETMANHLHKGSLIGIEGRIQTRNYENQQGQRVYVTEVVVNNFSFLESKSDQQGGYQGNQQQGSYQQNRQSSYQNNNQNNQYGSYQEMSRDPFDNNGQPIDIQDSDLPF